MKDSRLLAILPHRPATHAGIVFGSIPTSRPPARSLYIHVPFCIHKCHYCDFYSIVDTRDRQQAFVRRLISELRAQSPWARGTPLQTLFVGGGTPSLLHPDLWRELLGVLAGEFDLSDIRAGVGEFTVECNPETVTAELMAILRAGGVNRVSMGAQSFNPVHLKTLERTHDPDNVPKALRLAREAGIARCSIDLIFAIPGQTLADWEHDLAAALALGVNHVSCYALTYEPNTAMTARLRRGEFAPADEDLEAEMFSYTLDTLRALGLDRYEVSNFAAPGEECRHNLAYWRHDDWLAAGPAASGHMAGHRWKNVPRLDDYLSIDHGGFAPITDHEPPDPRRANTERILTGLRLREGLDREWLHAAATQQDAGSLARVSRLLDQLGARGLCMPDQSRLRLTDAGFLIADRIILDLVSALDPS